MTILVEIKVKGFLSKCVEKTSACGQNQRTEHLAINKRDWTLLSKGKLPDVI